MENIISRYVSCVTHDGGELMFLTNVSGDSFSGKSIKFNIEDKYCVLTEKQLTDLLWVVLSVLKEQKGFREQDTSRFRLVLSSGGIVDDEEEDFYV